MNGHRGTRPILLALAATLVAATTSCGGKLGELSGGGGEAKVSDTVTFVVPYSPGGGFDTTARTLAPFMEKYLPKGTTVTVKNVPGGNGSIGINEVMSAKPGQVIGIFNLPGFWVAPITGQADYDLAKVDWLGLAANTTYVAAASPKSGIKNLDDLRAKSTIDVGVAGLTDTASAGAQIALQSLGVRDKVKVTPHDGSSEALLSAVRGDMDFVQFPVAPLSDYVVGSDDLTPLWVYSDERLKDLPDTPTFEEIGGDPSLLQVISLYRAVGTTPDTPPDVLKALRTAMAKSMADPELLRQMRDRKLDPQYEDGEAMAKISQNGKRQLEKFRNLFE